MKILLAADGSRYSEWAARFLSRLQLSSSDAVTIFHSIDWMPFQYDEDFYFGTLKELKNKVAPDVLDPLLQILSATRAVKSVALDDGPPEQYILDAAVNLDADMIVMGSGGTKDIPGSVTKSITANSTMPVIVVKRPPDLKSVSMKILFATDGSEQSIATEELLSVIPFAGDTEVTVLNVTEANEKDVESEKTVHEAVSRLRKRFKNIRVELKIGPPSSGILKTAEDMEADLIAVGCRGLRGIKKMLGSVSNHVLTHSKCSVLIGKTCG
ncbi:MAG: universal stress protein [Nitrospirota bacterium]